MITLRHTIINVIYYHNNCSCTAKMLMFYIEICQFNQPLIPKLARYYHEYNDYCGKNES